MADEETTQNTSEEASQESGDETLDTLFGEPVPKEEAQAEVKTEAVADPEKEAKKQRDFEKAFFKQREENKRLKEELTQQAPLQTTPQTTADEEEGLKILRQVVKEAVEPSLAPYKEQAEQAILKDFKAKEYVDVLEDQIMEEYKSIARDPSSVNAEDLEKARILAIGKNINLITSTALEVGQEAGYKNRSFKQNQSTIGEKPNLPAASNDAYDRYAKGQLSDDEYRELKSDGTLDSWDKQQLGIN